MHQLYKKYWLLIRQSKHGKIHHSFCHKYGVPEYWFILYHSVKHKASFYFQNICPYSIINDPWYNTTIFSRLHGLSFEDYFKTSICDKYNLMCSIEVHENHKSVNKHKPVNYEKISGGDRPLASNSTE